MFIVCVTACPTGIAHTFMAAESLQNHAAAKGIELDAPVREVASIGLKIAFLTDPQGVYIELTEGLIDY